jgi:GntR family transcriptional regulator, rspAB operon transcriptional repressor
MSPPAPVVSVHQQISARLRADVLIGIYAPGETLREEQLAARFGVSRSPIRQVLQQLTREGLLHAKPNCGTVVAEPPAPEVMMVLLECRAKLECIALRQCFAQLDDGDFERWREILNALHEACDRDDHAAAYHQDMLFHQVIMDKALPAGSMGVYSVIAGATAAFLKVEANRPFHADFRELYAMHASLLAMFRVGDVEIACEALSQHITRGPFVEASCRCWTEAGKPREYAGIYDQLAESLRPRSASRNR